MAKKRKFLDFMDRFDGGGAGKMGDEFEGGGLLSVLANMAASPYGSEDETRRKARQDFYSSQNIGGGPQVGSARVMRPKARPASMTSGMSPLERFGGMPPAPYEAPSPLERFGGMPPAPYTAPSPLEQFGGMQPAPYTALAEKFVPADGNLAYNAEKFVPADGNLAYNAEKFAPPTGERSYTEFLNLLGPDVVRTNSPENLVAAYQEYRNSF